VREGDRAVLSLDGTWRFVADPERLYGADDLPEGEAIGVPGPWEAQVARPYRIVTAWYHREIPIPRQWSEGYVRLRFGAVMYRCSVYVNGRAVGGHEGGYTPFTLDITRALRPGSTNVIAVQVVNPLNGLDEYPAFRVEDITYAEEFEPDLPLSEAPHGKQTWYSSHSGLWQSVELEHTGEAALGPLRLRPDVANESVEVGWSIELGADRPRGGWAIELTVIDPDGRAVARERRDLADGESAGVLRLPVPEPRLWDVGQPNLYRAEAALFDGERAVDRIGDRFGMRTITTEGGRFLLNGRPLYLLAALDQDVYADTISTPPSRELLDRQFRLAREMGLNMLRCHIKVPDRAYLDAADEAGVLLWCELPNWTTFSSVSARRGRETLERMVDTMGNHPSIVMWTIINEDWGTQLRYEARDRRWLRETFDWLKALDPTRLVVDNSACETTTQPNFHVRTDVLDFHLYYLTPDNAARWRNGIADFARRPAWLWSPHGDADPRGDEPLVLSEFGSWGLPRVEPLLANRRREPWWFATGSLYYRPTGVRRRFDAYGLGRIWPSLDAFADATQWHQFEGLQYMIGQLRRHRSIQGYVITEFTDAYWEANGLLDLLRRPKVYHHRLATLNAPDVLVVESGRRDLCALEPLDAEITLSSYATDPPGRGVLRWAFVLGDGGRVQGELPIEAWPRGDAAVVARLHVDVPRVAATADARLEVEAVDPDGRVRASDEMRYAVLPAASRRTATPLAIAVHDPVSIFGVADRVRSLGHRVAPVEEAQLLVATEVTGDLVRRVEEDGIRALVLVRTRDALESGADLARRVDVVLRKYPVAGLPGQRSPWEGDWVSNYSWILPGVFPGLPERNPLDFAYEEVLPDHVLTGYDPARHLAEVPAGMIVGWVHNPAALVWTFRQGRGTVTLTTFQVAPESGPVATALLEGLIQHAATADRRAAPREVEQGTNGTPWTPAGARA